MKNLVLLLYAVLLFFAVTARAQPLAVGDPAPELKVSEWVKGVPVEVLEPDQTYVVEFWATWCPPCRSSIPHLTELAHRFTNVTVIGMNIWERADDVSAKVGEFVKDMGDRMDYTVAIDTDDQFMAENWMRAAGRNGIPSSFIVHEGRIAWIGHPMSMDEPLVSVSDGSFDFAAARADAEAELEEADELREIGKLMGRYLSAVRREGNDEDVNKLADKIADLDIDNARLLNSMAWTLLTRSDDAERSRALATRLARKAMKISDGEDPHILDTLARALWDSGETAEAIDLQQKAVELAPDNATFAVTLEKYLDETRPGGPPLRLQPERFGVAVVEVDGHIYALGGHSDHGMVGTVERFGTNAAATEVLTEMIQPRRFHVAAAHDGRIYIVGGVRPSSDSCGMDPALVLFEEFNPKTGEIRTLPDLPVGVCRTGIAVVDGKLYVIGGAEASGHRTPAVQIFDFETETWSRGADMPVAREGHIFAHEGRIIVPGGYDGTLALCDVQVYNPDEDAWAEMPDLPVKASAFQGVVADGCLYLFGDYEELDRVVACDLDTGEWKRLEIGYKPARHAGAARLGEAVYVVGGNVQSSSPFLARIQRFSLEELAAASREEWKPAPKKPERRSSVCRANRLLHIPAIPSRPDPDFFRLKWERDLNEAEYLPLRGSIVQSWFPLRYLVFTTDDQLTIRRTDTGESIHDVPLPDEVKSDDEFNGPSRFDYAFVRDGDGGTVFGTRTLYELTEESDNSRSYHGIGEQFMALSTGGDLLALEDSDSSSDRKKLHVLPAGPDRDVLLTVSWKQFTIMDARRNILLEEKNVANDLWIFRPIADGGIEVLVIGRGRMDCYELLLPGAKTDEAQPTDIQ